jgi:hypothetical protein
MKEENPRCGMMISFGDLTGFVYALSAAVLIAGRGIFNGLVLEMALFRQGISLLDQSVERFGLLRDPVRVAFFVLGA